MIEAMVQGQIVLELVISNWEYAIFNSFVHMNVQIATSRYLNGPDIAELEKVPGLVDLTFGKLVAIGDQLATPEN
jgi:hypothetical protein